MFCCFIVLFGMFCLVCPVWYVLFGLICRCSISLFNFVVQFRCSISLFNFVVQFRCSISSFNFVVLFRCSISYVQFRCSISLFSSVACGGSGGFFEMEYLTSTKVCI
jgi:hypothetical protein